jgi:hypothetical protein
MLHCKCLMYKARGHVKLLNAVETAPWQRPADTQIDRTNGSARKQAGCVGEEMSAPDQQRRAPSLRASIKRLHGPSAQRRRGVCSEC